MHRPYALSLIAGGFAGLTETGGARLDLEVPLSRRSKLGSGWVVAGSLGVANARFHGSDASRVVYVQSREARVGLGLGRIWSTRSWQLRARAGLLLRAMMKTDETWSLDDDTMAWTDKQSIDHEPAMLWGGEASLLISRRVGRHWAVLGGPIVSKDAIRDGLPEVSFEPDVTLFGGVSYTQ